MFSQHADIPPNPIATTDFGTCHSSNAYNSSEILTISHLSRVLLTWDTAGGLLKQEIYQFDLAKAVQQCMKSGKQKINKNRRCHDMRCWFLQPNSSGLLCYRPFAHSDEQQPVLRAAIRPDARKPGPFAVALRTNENSFLSPKEGKQESAKLLTPNKAWKISCC